MNILMIPLIIGFLSSFTFANEVTYGSKTVKASSPRMANRFFIKNTLLEIFGDSNRNKEIIDQNFFKVGESVGGPCDIYEQVYQRRDEVYEPDSECIGGKGASKLAFFPKTNILRTSYLIKTCTDLVMELPEESEILKGNSIVNTIEKSSKAFYPYGGDAALKSVLLAKSLGKDLTSKREVLLSYCLSPHWQSL